MTQTLPKHIAVIMDGNGRWAKQRQLPRIAGHRAGVETVRTMLKQCADLGVEVLTLFAFSSENWRRPATEVRLLMDLFVLAIDQEIDRLDENDVCIRIVGDRSAFPKKLQRCIEKAELRTADNKALTLVIAANYGGHWDIVRATKHLAEEVKAGKITADEINASRLAKHLCLADLPEPDLFIRSGGEQRISNFMLWQLAYTELYFTDCLWPDFDADEFAKALESYSTRQRRFGMTGEQVAEASVTALS